MSEILCLKENGVFTLWDGQKPNQDESVRLLTLNYARGMRRRERGVKVQGATSCAGRQESLVVLEVRGRGWDR